MTSSLISARNYLIQKKYQWILKPVFFRMDPETIHDRMASVLHFLGKFAFSRQIVRICFGYSHPSLKQNILGIHFRNPVGLSAGFDKDAGMIDIMPSLGFGFTEVGSVTGRPCPGNPKPRLWRLKKSRSLAVYYGLKNDGCEIIAKNLKNKKFKIPVGISIAKTNCRETAETGAAISDYFKAYTAFTGIGDYVTVNISCPNAYGGEPFTDPVKLEALLEKLMSVPKNRPVFLKISPDSSREEVDAIIKIASKYKIDGYVCTNLTKNRNNPNIVDKVVPERGGLSGKVLDALSDDLIRYVYKKTDGRAVIIGSGGVFSAEDAYRKIKAGASLIELITGMIFEGPQVISDINLGLAKLLKKDGYRNISEAVGKE